MKELRLIEVEVPVPPHTETTCKAQDLILGGKSGLLCANCGAECGLNQ